MRKVLLRSLSALVVAAAAVLVGWRVLAPAEVLAGVEPPYPVDSTIRPGVTGRMPVAPLIVDERIRVYASKRQIRADAPVHAETVYTAIWSFRRWPEQLSGVVAAGPTVISRWTDGDLVAIDGRTGKISWRVSGTKPADGFAGHRTGADTVWRPVGMRVAGDTVLVTAGAHVDAYAINGGTRRWTAALCADGFTTGGGRYVCADGAYDTATGTKIASFPAGPYTPLACDVASSGCRGLRDGAGQGWLSGAATLRRAPALDMAGSTVAGDLVFQPKADALVAVDPVSGAFVRRYPAGAQVLGTAGDIVVLLTADRRLMEVAATARGKGRLIYAAAYGPETRKWDVGGVQVTSRFVAIERLAPGGPKSPDTPGYYYSVDTVLVAEV
ncbi:outer membrane protein assembly factor BamB family protein [Paractinoplanes durhamensis]|uniref:Pyrrolo-quinoline quinone repeat domain-containing protein n=1 Tax=Paractinoplanes durhamensis TaxID=113563 RepID=A0ABQ3Z7H8_9ACTN|nr:PQQ-binding-like beta-propeller repeat protein [Actinoplanes durhamensis]GIE05793.1 hypothetical protein Adu01nite_71430 [Actinoplanes durhamensis]